MKQYTLTGTNPIHLPDGKGERVITPGTPDAEIFEHDIPVELEKFLIQVEAIKVLSEE